MHQDTSGKFFWLENVGTKKMLTTQTKQVHIKDHRNLDKNYNGTELFLETYYSNSSDDQKWVFKQMEDGKVCIQHFRDGRVIDINEWKLQENQNVNVDVQTQH